MTLGWDQTSLVVMDRGKGERYLKCVRSPTTVNRKPHLVGFTYSCCAPVHNTPPTSRTPQPLMPQPPTPRAPHPLMLQPPTPRAAH